MAMSSYEPYKGKRCTFVMNGDINKSRELVVEKHWDPFLEKLTDALKSNVAIDRIATPTGGTLLKNLEDVETGKRYVAIPKSKPFKKGIE